MSAPKRTLLFLMGPTSNFWRELAAGFEADGCRVVKVCFALGDWLYWRRAGALHYRGRLSRWRGFLEALIHREGITDILYYADRQPYHLVASDVAREHGIRAMTIENGYLRPDWITLELGGMGAHSHFPILPDTVRSIAANTPQPDLTVRYPHGFFTEMIHEATFHLLNYSWRVFYPFYNSGKYYDPLLEIFFGILRLMGRKAREDEAREVIARRVSASTPYFVCALQLQGDYQIRANSPYRGIGEMIEEVVASFAAHAPTETQLVFKQHPHDNNRENWARVVRNAAHRHALADRVSLIDGGDLGLLLSKAAGCVMINSTVGLFSLRFECPTKILGIAIYDMPGLTHQGTLDGFWNAPSAIDTDLLDAFVRALAFTIQVKGSFYNPEGKRAAIDEIVSRVIEHRVNAPGAFVDPPPRLEKARAMGVPV
jgi:capsular polysaccharide export protein